MKLFQKEYQIECIMYLNYCGNVFLCCFFYVCYLILDVFIELENRLLIFGIDE